MRLRPRNKLKNICLLYRKHMKKIHNNLPGEDCIDKETIHSHASICRECYRWFVGHYPSW